MDQLIGFNYLNKYSITHVEYLISLSIGYELQKYALCHIILLLFILSNGLAIDLPNHHLTLTAKLEPFEMG